MPSPGDIVIADFVGATGAKRRPAVVLSSDLYHTHRPDIILGVITTNIGSATGPTDYVIIDWASAGLNRPSAFRAYVGMTLHSSARTIGRLSERDWDAVRQRVRLALA